MDISNRVVETALRNGGSITSAEIQALGASREWLARRATEGWLERCGPGTYRLPGAESEWHSILAAACHRLGGVVSHESAAELHDLPRLRRGLLIVSVAVRRSNRYPGVDVRQKTDLSPEQITDIKGLPVTTPARTIIDLAGGLGVKRLSRLTDSAVGMGLTSHESVLTLFEQLARRGKPGTRTMRTVMESRGGVIEGEPSELEQRLLDLIDRASLPSPRREFSAPWLAPTNGRVDLAYNEHRLVIEGDSRRWHMLADAFLTEGQPGPAGRLAGAEVHLVGHRGAAVIRGDDDPPGPRPSNVMQGVTDT